VVAWNIDGSEIKKYDRKGLEFQLDPRIDAQYQIGNDVYADNKLDRGHIARRADLVWGPATTAKAANRDSFYYTNIAPQHQAFNQSERHGLWGLLENAIYEDVEVEALRVAVMGGPVFKADDMTYRGIRIPAAFWKAIFYREDGVLRSRAYVLTQDNLLDDIEALQLDPFRVYQISFDDLELRAKLRFDPALKAADTFAPQSATPQVVGVPGRAREVQTRADVVR
jgi:endonuclease G, mitochondrial